MLTTQDLIFGVGLPAIVAALLAFFSGRWVGISAAVAVGYLVGHVAIASWPGFPAPTTEEWLPYLGVVAAVADWAMNRWAVPVVRWPAVVAAFGLLIGLTVYPLVPYTWSVAGMLVRAGVALLIGIGLWWGQQGCLQRAPPTIVSIAWLMVTGTTAIACALGASQKLGQLGGALAASLGGVVLLGFWASGRTMIVRGGLVVVLLLWLAVLLNGYLYASLPWWAAILLIVSPMGLSVNLVADISRWKAWQLNGLSLLLVAIPLIAVAIPMVIQFAKSMSPGDAGGPYGY